MTEVWKDYPGYEGHYQCSFEGQMRSIKFGKEKILRGRMDKDGYFSVVLYKDGIGKSHKVHRCVAETFIANPDNLPFVCHKDDNPANNRVNNLFWGTNKENQDDSHKKGRHIKPKRPLVGIAPDGLVKYEFESSKEAERKTGIPQPSIWRCCNGKRKTAGGLKWRYAD